jgi:hypothetical protein
MKLTSIVTILLLVFVGGSIFYFFTKESGAKQDAKSPQTVKEPAKTSDTVKAEPVTAAAPETTKPKLQPSRTIVYYFHGNKRCTNCIHIENWTNEAIHSAFPVDFKDGYMEWKVVNTDEPANEHFVKDYQLTNKSVVLVRLVNGKQTDWKNLTGVWMHLNDQQDFMNFMNTEVRTFISGG